MAKAAAPTEGRRANRRGAARLAAVQALYQMDLAATPLNDALAQLQQQRQAHAKERGYWMQALTADNLDVAALNAKADAHAKTMADTAKNIIIPAVAKVHDILTPAQRKQLAGMVQNHAGTQGGFGGPEL